MSQFNSNRLWVFESAYETDTVLYRPNVGRPAKDTHMSSGANLVHCEGATMVVVEVTRLDGLGRQDNAAWD